MLRDYNKKVLNILGAVMVNVTYNSQNFSLPIVVIKGERASLLGRNCLQYIQLNWKTIFESRNVHNVHSNANVSCELQTLLAKYDSVFNSELGCLKGVEVKLKVNPNAVPIYKSARPVPYHLRGLVEEELKRLQDSGVIVPVTYSEWASPTVNVLKANGKNVRICADFKQTLNPVCNVEQYPLPTPEDLFESLARGKYFTKLDLSNAYHQIKLHEEAQKFMVISTHKGLFAYTRLQYGLNSAVGIFQRAMENVLNSIPYIAIYLDDILISAPTLEEHFRILEMVLKRLQ